jgi:hypothetical protein
VFAPSAAPCDERVSIDIGASLSVGADLLASSLFASPTERRLRIDARLTRDAVRPTRNDPVLPVGGH